MFVTTAWHSGVTKMRKNFKALNQTDKTATQYLELFELSETQLRVKLAKAILYSTPAERAVALDELLAALKGAAK